MDKGDERGEGGGREGNRGIGAGKTGATTLGGDNVFFFPFLFFSFPPLHQSASIRAYHNITNKFEVGVKEKKSGRGEKEYAEF